MLLQEEQPQEFPKFSVALECVPDLLMDVVMDTELEMWDLGSVLGVKDGFFLLEFLQSLEVSHS